MFSMNVPLHLLGDGNGGQNIPGLRSTTRLREIQRFSYEAFSERGPTGRVQIVCSLYLLGECRWCTAYICWESAGGAQPISAGRARVVCSLYLLGECMWCTPYICWESADDAQPISAGRVQVVHSLYLLGECRWCTAYI